MTTEPASVPASREAFEFAQFRLAEQMRAVEGIDSKAERVFGVALGIAGLLGAFATLTASQLNGDAAKVALLYGALTLVAFGASACFCYLGFRVTDWEIGPDSEDFLNVAATHADTQVRTWLVEWMIRSYETNQLRLDVKGRWFRWALRSTALEGGFFLTGVASVAIIRLPG